MCIITFKEQTSYNTRKNDFTRLLAEERITTLFQPIVSLKDGSIFGIEALSRGPANSIYESPIDLFDMAESMNMTWELELICRKKALQKFKQENLSCKLFLNVDPNIMHDSSYTQGLTREYLQSYSLAAEDIIFEITERAAIRNMTDFVSVLNNYKSQEYKIAVDDVGAGYSGLNMISDIRPHYIKIDMNLIRNVDKDRVKEALIKSMYEFSRISNTDIVAEGIETEAELLTLINMGIDYGQGYFIKKPVESDLQVSEGIVQLIRSHQRGGVNMNKVTYKMVRDNAEVNAYINAGDKALGSLGFTDHSQAHVTKVAKEAGMILDKLGYSHEEVELVKIAAYMHDIGNTINRTNHAHSSALLARSILKDMGMGFEDISRIMIAIGNHDEKTGVAVDPISAALILADKSDVRRSRVRNKSRESFDIHDRVNYAAIESNLSVDTASTTVNLHVTLDNNISSSLDYYEIFLDRMLMCRRAAEVLGYKFKFLLNEKNEDSTENDYGLRTIS